MKSEPYISSDTTHPVVNFLFGVVFFAGAFFVVIGIPALLLSWWLTPQEPAKPKPYNPMSCYVMTADGEYKSCP